MTLGSSYNQIFGLGVHTAPASLQIYWPMQDDAASSTVLDYSGNSNHGALNSGNTETYATTGPTGWLQSALAMTASFQSAYLSLAGPSSGGLTIGVFANIIGGDFGWKVAQSSGNTSYAEVTEASSKYGAFGRNTTGNDILITDGSTSSGMHMLSLMIDEVTGGNAKLFKDGSQIGSTDAFSNSYASLAQFSVRGANGWGTWPNITACHAFRFDDVVTDAEHLKIAGGPEVNYSSGVSWDEDGNFDVGTWALPSPFVAGSNGTVTYEVVATNAAGDTIDTASSATGTLDISAESGNTVYLLVRATNTNGYDIGDAATRTSGFGSAGDGYYELASVTAAGGGGGLSVPIAMYHYKRLMGVN